MESVPFLPSISQGETETEGLPRSPLNAAARTWSWILLRSLGEPSEAGGALRREHPRARIAQGHEMCDLFTPQAPMSTYCVPGNEDTKMKRTSVLALQECGLGGEVK